MRNRDAFEPLAEGLPVPADASTKKVWRSRLEIKDGMMLKDGEPFFAIGYTAYGRSQQTLAQLKSMGCNAVHYEFGWKYMNEDGSLNQSAMDWFLGSIHDAADYGIVSFPLLTGHYIPGWFREKHPPENCWPLGSDGKKTGHWMEYSLHHQPFREEIVKFWKAVAPQMASEPSVMAIQYWNEPSYGGAWAWPDQFSDYRPYAIDDYRRHLKGKYGSIDQLGKAHGQDYADFADVQPPRRPDEQGRVAWLDWMEYGQHYFAGFFDWQREIIRSVSPQARLCNKKQTNPWDNSAASSGTNWHLMQKGEDIFGLNIYWSSLFGARDVLDGARSYANGKPVVVFETNAMPPNAEARTAERVRCQLWAQVLGGADGMMLYAITTDPSHGLLSDKAVKPSVRPEYVRFTRDISKHQRQLASPHVPARIAVLYSTSAALQHPDNTVPKHVMNTFDLFRNSHYQADILPQERCDLENLCRYELVVLPSHCILKNAELEALNSFVAQGGKLMAFGKSLATDEYLDPIDPPTVLGIERREPPIGNRSSQKLTWFAPQLLDYDPGEPPVAGIEKISEIANDPARIIQGIKIEANQKGEVLALNRDAYPAIILAPGGNVVYCAFESTYSDPLRALVEGIVREFLGIKQKVRLLSEDLTEPAIMTSLRQDYKDADKRYLMAMNTSYKPRTVEIELEPNWQLKGEYFHGLKKLDHCKKQDSFVTLPAREVFLFELLENQRN